MWFSPILVLPHIFCISVLICWPVILHFMEETVATNHSSLSRYIFEPFYGNINLIYGVAWKVVAVLGGYDYGSICCSHSLLYKLRYLTCVTVIDLFMHTCLGWIQACRDLGSFALCCKSSRWEGRYSGWVSSCYQQWSWSM